MSDNASEHGPSRENVSRRAFIRFSASAAGGFAISYYLPARAGSPPVRGEAQQSSGAAVLGAFITIEPDGAVTIFAKNPEIGTGTRTALPMLVAEELEIEWSRVSVVPAPHDARFGEQFTGGSTAIWNNWLPMRRAGAAAREALIRAAATRWQVASAECTTGRGVVVHEPSGRRASYGELAADAARLDPAKEPPLRASNRFRLIGTRVRNVDTEAIVTGRQEYGLDVRVPGVLVAMIVKPPFSGRVRRIDESAALAIPGVMRVVRMPARPNRTELVEGVAVVARDTWSAIRGRRALTVEWDDAESAKQSTVALEQECRALLQRPGQPIRDDGNVDAALGSAAHAIEATYQVPFLAHVPMEPVNCTAHVRDGHCDVWGPMQDPDDVKALVASVTGFAAAAVTVHMTRAGGGFGRRLMSDYAAEAAFLSQAAGAPVKVIWTREDDLQHDYYRPAGWHHLRAGLDAGGRPLAWTHHLANASRYAFAGSRQPAVASELYKDDFPAGCLTNVRLSYSPAASAIPAGAWRATLHSSNAFAVQSFVDELAHAAGQDPVAFRLTMLGAVRELPYAGHGGPVLDTGRLAAVLRLATQRAGWEKPLPRGRGRGVALHFTFGTYAAHVAEVTVDADGKLRVDRIVAAFDCGIVVNRSGAEAQAQGGILDGLGAALFGEITVDAGRVQQTNFHQYRMLRMREAPRVEVYFIESAADPRGMGEPPVPPVAPAVANAIFAATGRRIRTLPLVRSIKV
jgi:isoquinoline 1-oxidoreductase beta subunit